MIISDKTKEWLSQNDFDINDINRVGKYGNSALMKAAREAKLDIMKEILKLEPNLEIQNIDGNTALWNACFGGNTKCVELLIQNGINLDNTNDNGVTALMYCASAGHLDMTQLLVSNSANKDITNLDGFKAIDLASTRNIYKTLKND
jgi:ankyrin repeat protein